LDSTMISAMNEHYHPQCFVCYHCKKPFPNGKFVAFKGRAYCKSDFDWICASCGVVITDDHVQRNSERFHPNCLKCDVCKKVVGSTHRVLNEKVLCDEDYELEKKASLFYSAPAAAHGTCAACHQPIYFHPKAAEGAVYHEYCFVCTYCKNSLRGAYNKHQGFPICPQCEQFICGGCNKVIDSEFVTLEGRKLHPSCVKCAFCGKPVNHKSYQKRDGKPCCADCMQK